MATAYYAPGVYIEEPDRGTKPIEGVSTSVTAFIGFTEKAEEDIENHKPMRRSILSKPKTITNWNQYLDHFGGLVEGGFLPYAIRGFFENGGIRCYVLSICTLGEPHRAQALLEAKDERTEKWSPYLFLRAKKGGPAGEKLGISIQPQPAKAGELQNFTLIIKGGKAITKEVPIEVEEPILGADGKPEVDAQGKPKTRKTTKQEKKEVFEDIKIDNLTLKHLPHWDMRDVQLKEIDRVLSTDEDFERAFDRILGRGFDRDFVSKKEDYRKAKDLYKQLSKAGMEVWRGVDTDRPVRIVLEQEKAKLETTLKIEGTSKFNVDVDERLLAQDAKNALKVAQDTGNRFDIVGPEQIRGYGRKGISALEEKDDVNLICAPDLMMMLRTGKATEDQVKSVQQIMIAHCQNMQFRFAILDTPEDKDPDSIREWRLGAGFDPQHGHAALYYPWIKIDDPLNPGKKISMPPSGHMAGIYSRSDTQRGVHKAPANETVIGALDVEYNVNQAEQGMLNPLGINCIRKFPGRGIRVWGARTLALTDASWRYINVRRVFNYVEASIERATQWVVFEPNDPLLWGKVRRDVNAFMRTVWLSGALFGNTPDEAFYVKCDEELNPMETRDLGYLFIEIGMAPVKPAEFVVFRISQWAGPNAEA